MRVAKGLVAYVITVAHVGRRSFADVAGDATVMAATGSPIRWHHLLRPQPWCTLFVLRVLTDSTSMALVGLRACSSFLMCAIWIKPNLNLFDNAIASITAYDAFGLLAMFGS